MPPSIALSIDSALPPGVLRAPAEPGLAIDSALPPEVLRAPAEPGLAIVTASTIRPSRLAWCHATPAASSARSQRRSGSSIVRGGGQLDPGRRERESGG